MAGPLAGGLDGHTTDDWMPDRPMAERLAGWWLEGWLPSGFLGSFFKQNIYYSIAFLPQVLQCVSVLLAGWLDGWLGFPLMNRTAT
jgi:hypothetical protein